MSRYESQLCHLCATECTSHPDAANPIAYCGDCGGVTCLDHRVADEAQRCNACAAIFYAAPPVLTVTIARSAASTIGLDDPCLMADIARVWGARHVECTGSAEAIGYLAAVLFDYTGEDGDDIGEGFSRAHRRACGVASRKIRTVLAGGAR